MVASVARFQLVSGLALPPEVELGEEENEWSTNTNNNPTPNAPGVVPRTLYTAERE